MSKLLPATALILTAILFLYNFKGSEEVSDEVDIISIQNLQEIPPGPAVDLYGFIGDELDYIESEIKRNESLYVILTRHNVSPQTVFQIQQSAIGIINLNRLMPGQNYRIYKKNGSVKAFVWHQSATNYTTIHIQEDVISIEDGTLPIEHNEREDAAVITNSLYEAIYEAGATRYLGSEIADIFAWEIDFFALQRGDHFRVIYDELYAADEFVGLGDIKAAEFQHRGRVYRAYYFDNGERRGYFDKNGNSLQKELLKAPFRYSQRVSSGFSNNRVHPILRQRRPHHGIDYAAPTGTPILAVGDGVVIEAQRRGGNGNIVQIRHNNKYKTAYLHLKGFAAGIRKGVEVEQGQIIGYVGSTGLATGSHLCYRLYVNSRPVNSLTADLPASDSLEDEYMDEFMSKVEKLDSRLNTLTISEKYAIK